MSKPEAVKSSLQVSAIIPVYNCELYLEDAVKSVLGQTHQPLELIIVDDGSTDRSREIAHSFDSPLIHYTYQDNRGPAAARNTGLRMACGDAIGFLDSDDVWPEDKLEVQGLRLVENPSVEIVLGRTQLMDKAGIADGKARFEKISEPQLALKLDSALILKSVFENIGLFDENLLHGDDWDWFMRAREAGVSMLVHSEIAAFYRRHEDNLSNQVERGNRYTLMMLKKSLDRRRKKGKGQVSSLPKMSCYKEARKKGR